MAFLFSIYPWDRNRVRLDLSRLHGERYGKPMSMLVTPGEILDFLAGESPALGGVPVGHHDDCYLLVSNGTITIVESRQVRGKCVLSRTLQLDPREAAELFETLSDVFEDFETHV